MNECQTQKQTEKLQAEEQDLTIKLDDLKQQLVTLEEEVEDKKETLGEALIGQNHLVQTLKAEV